MYCKPIIIIIIIIITTTITVVLIKRGIQMFLRAEHLNASELKNRKLVFKIKKKRAGSKVRIKSVHIHGFSNQCHQ